VEKNWVKCPDSRGNANGKASQIVRVKEQVEL